MSETKDNLHNWRIKGRYWVRGDGLLVPVIQGGGPANTVQNDKFAFGDDDGSESGHSLDTENTNRTAQEADVTFMFRVQVEETAGGVDNLTAALYAQKNGSGGFLAVPYSATNNGLRLANDTQSRTDDELTTQRLSYSGGTSFQQGRYDDGTGAVGTSAVSLDQDNNGVTDFEFAILIDSANASDNDYWELRVEWVGGADLDGYPTGNYPTVTADIGAAPQTVVLDTAPISATGVVSDIDAPLTTGISTAAMTVTGVTSSATAQPPAQSVVLGTAAITATGVAFEQINQTVKLSTASITATGVASDIDAPITRVMDTAALAIAGVVSTPSATGGPQTVVLSSAALTATGVTTTINAPIAVLFDTAPMTLAGVLFSVSTGGGVTVILDTA